MPQTPTGLVTTTLAAMARLVGSSATFRTLTGTATEAAALTRVYYHEADDREESRSPRPRAIISFSESWKLTREGPGTWMQSGDLNLALELTIPTAYLGDIREEAVYFDNNLGEMLLEMRNNSGLANGSAEPYLNVIAFELLNDPMPCHEPEENEYFWGAEMRIGWN